VPTYTYRCPAGHEVRLTHGMTEDPTVACLVFVPVGAEGATEPCDMRMSRVILSAPVALLSSRETPTQLTRTKGVDKREGYQPLLARFPGDPQAYTSGKNAKDRLVDQRLREGWIEVPSPRDQKLTGRPDGMKDPVAEAVRKVKEGKVEVDLS
jgi:hypothetical protein